MTKVSFVIFCFFLSATSWAQTAPVSTSSSQPNPNSATPKPERSLHDVLGVSFFSFFNGPGFTLNTLEAPPNAQGRPSDNGINFFNLVSLKYKFSSKWALDLQTRFQVFMNNGVNADNFNTFRWEAPRIGISGPLATGQNWRLNGALNTDFPSFLPIPLTGYTAKKRTVMFNPGLFANFRYQRPSSKWSLGGVVAPRFFLYSDRLAAEPELGRGGQGGANKPEVVVAFLPTVNYMLGSGTDLSIGSSIDYRKQIGSKWNPLNASIVNNGAGDKWRLQPIPITVGVTQKLTTATSIFPYIQFFPIARQRVLASNGKMASILESASFGFWFSGTLF